MGLVVIGVSFYTHFHSNALIALIERRVYIITFQKVHLQSFICMCLYFICICDNAFM